MSVDLIKTLRIVRIVLCTLAWCNKEVGHRCASNTAQFQSLSRLRGQPRLSSDPNELRLTLRGCRVEAGDDDYYVNVVVSGDEMWILVVVSDKQVVIDGGDWWLVVVNREWHVRSGE